jgi:hypothetical protein
VKAIACADAVAREERIRAARSLRYWTDPDGTGRIDVRGPVCDTARILASLEPFERVIFDASRTDELRDHADAYAFDALVAMGVAAAGAGDHMNVRRPSRHTVVVIRVDHTALVRRAVTSGEVCEIAGGGPVPVHEASRLLDDAFLQAVVVKDADVVAVRHLGRAVPARLRTAVAVMYPECALDGCHRARHLEIDHNIPIEANGPTALWNLSRLCTFHHRYKHAHDLRLAGDGTHKHFVTPESAGSRSPPNDA